MNKESKHLIGSVLKRCANSRCLRWMTLPATLMTLVTAPAIASAATADLPAWSVAGVANPTNFSASEPAGTDNYLITITNSGAAASSGTVTFTDTLPAGLTLEGPVRGTAIETAGGTSPTVSVLGFSCTGATGASTVTCTDANAIAPGAVAEISIPVTVASSGVAASVTNDVQVSGGGATNPGTAEVSAGTTGATPAYGLTAFTSQTSNSDGSPDTQAGSHPYSVTDTLNFATKYTTALGPGFVVAPVQDPKDVNVDLPPGLVGNPTQTPVTCTIAQLGTTETEADQLSECPVESQVGIAAIGVHFSSGTSASVYEVPIYNMVPAAGEPARFGVYIDHQIVLFDASVRSGGDYGLTVSSTDLTQALELYSGAFTFWGNPSDASHDALRASYCDFPQPSEALCYGGDVSTDMPAEEFLTNPEDCSAGPLTTIASTDSWQNPGGYQTSSYRQGAMTGCGSVPFTPSLSITPTTTTADSPSGLNVDISLPNTNAPTGLAEGTLQNASVTLPRGVTVDPSAASGLTGCAQGQIGMSNANPPSCPNSSKVGTVEIDTPLLSDPLTGSVYIAQQNNNPFGSMLAIYVSGYADGVWVKLAGKVTANPVTGQLTTTFADNPQLPFSDLKLDFFGGSNGIIATPADCGSYTTSSSLAPWSGGAAATPSVSFSIDSGCVSGFEPTFTTGTQNPQAGAFSPLVLTLQRSDTDQNLSGLSVKLPEGMLAELAGVAECSDAALAGAAARTGAQELAAPSCPANSQIGTVQVGSGVGPDPFFLSGKAYLTGPYKGAPYGIAVVVPAVAGPYDLGTVVVRQQLRIDADAAQVTDVSDPFPTILQGIPLDIRRVDVDLNRSGFTLNPTSCDPMAVTGALTSTGGLTDDVSSRFQVGGCGALGFSPSLSVTPGTSVADSPAGVSVDLRFPQSGLTSGTGLAQQSLRNASVTLPAGVSLDPSAATGLEACSEAQFGVTANSPLKFDQDAPTCPAGSRVGSVRIDTPLLSDPLTGSIYLAQQTRNPFGSTFAVYLFAQGDRVSVKLAGRVVADPQTGQLTTTFSDNPQVPFSDLHLQFNSGPHAVLATPGACGSYTTDSSLSPWAGFTTATPSSVFGVSSGCQTGFAPASRFRSQSTVAGAFSPFVFSFERSDTDQFVKGLTVKLAPGMLAKLAGVAQCTTAQIRAARVSSGTAEQASPSCPAASQVGTVTTSAGVGPDPFSLAGKAYLTGRYKGAPFGLAVVVPALAGPFDLGTVVVREQLRIDPTTAQATVVSDPLPQIVDGVPLRLRQVSVDLDRPGFTVNPTSCEKLAVGGSLSSTEKLSHPIRSGFRASGCAKLGFRPKLAIGLSGKGQTRSGDHPTLTANLTNPSGTANIKTAKVTLPLSLALDPDNSMHVCGFTTAAKVHGGRVGCKPSTVVGSATAVTPLLDRALSGKVYLVQGLRCQKGQPNAGGKCPHGQTAIRTLPSLLVALRGQIALDLRAQTSTSHGKLQTTFKQIPDAPVSKFTLNIKGGRKGLLVITGRGRSICTSKQVGNARFGAQSDKTRQHNMRLSTPCTATD